jgi:lysophospholipase L1-like esterase
MTPRRSSSPEPLGAVHRVVALGDSFTEGLEDVREDGTYRGWADVVAEALAARNPGLQYANLAVRGRRLARIRDEQVSRAVAMRPDLVTLAAGGNDIIGFRCDVAALAEELHVVLCRLVATGASVVVFAGFDPRGRLPMGRLIAARAMAYNSAILDSAHELGVHVVDLWHLAELYQDQMWAPDRLHLSPGGHGVVAAAVLAELGITPTERESVAEQVAAEAARLRWVAARRADATWFRTHFAPWVGRQVRGRSTGDFVEPKRAELAELPARSIDLRDPQDVPAQRDGRDRRARTGAGGRD